jgi:hypothetical protein
MIHEHTTPAGVLIAFEDGEPNEAGARKRRCYYVNGEKPRRGSVTGILDMLDKPGLKWWSEGLAVEGCIQLARDGGLPLSKEAALGRLTQEGLRHFQVSEKKADRGKLSHEDLVRFALGEAPRPLSSYPVEDQGFIRGVSSMLADLRPEIALSEYMVASVEHGYAGRPDMQAVITAARLPDGTPAPRGVGLLDLKTVDKFPRSQPSKTYPLGNVKTPYPENLHQLGLYEVAGVEAGYPRTDYRAVVRVSADGEWDLTVSWLEPEMSLALLPAFDAFKAASQRVKRATDQLPVGLGEPVAA